MKMALPVFYSTIIVYPLIHFHLSKLTGLTILYPTDEDNINDESTILDKVVTDEGRRSFNAVNQ